MANTQAQFGFRHIGFIPGTAPTYEMSVRAIQSTNSTAIGFGDPVQRANNTSPYIVQASNTVNATSAPLEGIFVGCQYQPSGGIPTWSNYWPGTGAASDAVAYVIDNPGALFLVATLETAITSASIGKVVNFTTGAPTTANGFSIATVDESTLAGAGGTAVSGLPFRVYSLYGPSYANLGNNGPGIVGGVGNGTDASSDFNWVVVTFNNQINRAPGPGF